MSRQPLTSNGHADVENLSDDAPVYDLYDEETDVHLATVEEKKRLWWRNAIINLLFIAAWFLFATVLSVYNKWMFSPEHFGFPAPLFVTTMHMAVQFVLAGALRTLIPLHFRPKHNPSRRDYTRKTMPTGIATGLDIGLSNLSLKTITLSFYTMVKSSSLVFVLLFAFLFRLETFSFRLIGVIALIVTGVVLMVATETHFILGGFILVLSGSALSGLRWSLTQLLLKDKQMGMDNPVATIFWLAPVMGVTLGVVSMVVEDWVGLFGSVFFSGAMRVLRTIFFLTAPGFLAFSMILSEFYIIKRAGVVPMSIAGIAKEVTTITVSAWFFGDELTPLNITGVAITVCGIALFTYHKYRKSIGSSVPLDAHGNPILEDDPENTLRSVQYTSLEERQPLTHFPNDDNLPHSQSDSEAYQTRSPSVASPHQSQPLPHSHEDVLFDIGEGDDHSPVDVHVISSSPPKAHQVSGGAGTVAGTVVGSQQENPWS